MGGLFSILMIVIIFSAIRSFSAAGKNANKGAEPKSGAAVKKTVKATPADTGMDRQFEKEFPHLYQQVSMEDAMQGRQGSSDSGYGSLGPVTPQGVDPCHDDLHTMPTGSLGADSMEGRDPCHDDPYAVPSGSLAFDSMEGEDPCHEGHLTALPEEASEAVPGGLNLRWTGDEMVKGFVYGEILRRKVS